MKALVFNGPGKIIYEDFPDPKLEDDRNMIIAVKKCSICGSDLHPYQGATIGKRDYSQSMEKFCTGHEMLGEVVELGSSVKNHKIGDMVIVAGGKGCGECTPCKAGLTNICEGYAKGKMSTAYGLSAELQGGHSDYFQVHNADLGAIRIPNGISQEQAMLLTDALPTGYFGVRNAQVKSGDTIAVIGQGPVGLMATESALAAGAERVYSIKPNEARRLKSQNIGAIALSPEAAVPHIIEDTKGLGVDAVVDAVGKEVTIKQAMKLAKLGGHVSVIGIIPRDAKIPLFYFQMKSVNLNSGIVGISSLWKDLIPMLLEGKIKGENVFTHHFDLKDGAQAYELFEARKDGVMKIMITP